MTVHHANAAAMDAHAGPITLAYEFCPPFPEGPRLPWRAAGLLGRRVGWIPTSSGSHLISQVGLGTGIKPNSVSSSTWSKYTRWLTHLSLRTVDQLVKGIDTCRPVGGTSPAGPRNTPVWVPSKTDSSAPSEPSHIIVLIVMRLSGKASCQPDQNVAANARPLPLRPPGALISVFSSKRARKPSRSRLFQAAVPFSMNSLVSNSQVLQRSSADQKMIFLGGAVRTAGPPQSTAGT